MAWRWSHLGCADQSLLLTEHHNFRRKLWTWHTHRSVLRISVFIFSFFRSFYWFCYFIRRVHILSVQQNGVENDSLRYIYVVQVVVYWVVLSSFSYEKFMQSSLMLTKSNNRFCLARALAHVCVALTTTVASIGTEKSCQREIAGNVYDVVAESWPTALCGALIITMCELVCKSKGKVVSIYRLLCGPGHTLTHLLMLTHTLELCRRIIPSENAQKVCVI